MNIICGVSVVASFSSFIICCKTRHYHLASLIAILLTDFMARNTQQKLTLDVFQIRIFRIDSGV